MHIEPVAVLNFLFVDTVPALVACGALVLLLAVVLRQRLAVAIVALALLGLTMWVHANAPSYLLPAISLLHINDNWASDLAPRFADVRTLLQRGSVLLAAAGFLLWAAALYKRADDRSRKDRSLLGALLVGLGVLGIGGVVVHCIEERDRRAGWLTAHEQALGMPTAIVRHIEGEVGIDPGRRLDLDLVLRIETPDDTNRSPLAFSFNPGLEISELRLDDQEAAYRHESGLLAVELPEGFVGRAPTTLKLRATGVPDADFAYLDSIVDWRVKSSRSRLLWLGTAAGIFDSSYVALTPALRWLPVPGPNLTDASRGHFPTVDLTVNVPDDWLAAGPGRGEPVGEGGFRFRPAAAVPHVGVFAAQFERHAIRVADVELELLLDPDHWSNLAALADTRELLEAYLEELLNRPSELGMEYPYDGFAVVEVPSHLREYGGGWALDTALELPGLLLLKEHGIPFADFQQYEGGIYAGFPGGPTSLKAETLKLAFTSAYHNVSLLRSLSRHLTAYQMQAVGPGARALDGVVEELCRFLLSEQPTIPVAFYNALSWDVEDSFGRRVTQAVQGLLASPPDDPQGFRFSMSLVQPATWERVLGASVAELDMERDSVNAKTALRLRVDAAARSMKDVLGTAAITALLATLRARHHGGTFDADDFNGAGVGVDADLEQLLGDWLNEAALPGFRVSEARVAGFATEDGSTRYQTRVHVRNDEPVAGLVRLATGGFNATRTDPIRIPGNSTVRIGMVTEAPPDQLWLEPYLALNRTSVWIDVVDETDEETSAGGEPLVGARPSTWVPPAIEGIVIDDLHPGFSVETHDGRPIDRSRTPHAGQVPDLDHGLPRGSRTPGEWYRVAFPTSWGRYRHTVAGAAAGDGGQVATFAVDLPAPGRWRLDFHVPDPHVMPRMGRAYGTLGNLEMNLVADGEPTPAPFDGAEAEAGWNKIGEFEFASTQVRLEITSRTDGDMVVADAIRWMPLN